MATIVLLSADLVADLLVQPTVGKNSTSVLDDLSFEGYGSVGIVELVEGAYRMLD